MYCNELFYSYDLCRYIVVAALQISVVEFVVIVFLHSWIMSLKKLE